MNKTDLELLTFALCQDSSIFERMMEDIKEIYIEEYGEMYREKITENFNRTNIIYQDNIDSKENLIKFIKTEYIKDYLSNLMSELSKLNNKECENLISTITYKLNLIETNKINPDFSLTEIFKDLLCIMSQILEKSSDINIIKFLGLQSTTIVDCINLFKKIDIIDNNVKSIKNKIENTKETMQKDFLLKHRFLLTDSEYNQIFNDGIQVNKVIKDSDNLHLYLSGFFTSSVFELGICNLFNENCNDSFYNSFKENILEKYNVRENITDEILLDSEKCLSLLRFKWEDEHGNILFGKKALDTLIYELNELNVSFKAKTEDLKKYSMTKEEFVQKYIISEEILNKENNFKLRKFLKTPGKYFELRKFFKKPDMNNYESFFNSLSSHMLATLDNIPPDFSAAHHPVLLSNQSGKYVIQYIKFNLTRYFKYENQELKTTVLNEFVHELGHVATNEKDNSNTGFFKDNDEHRILNELYNEYLAQKVLKKLLIKYPQYTKYILYDINIYLKLLFLIEPLLIKYEDVFKECSMNNSTIGFENLMGKDSFLELSEMIDNVYSKFKENSFNDDFFIHEEEYIEQITQKTNSIFEQINIRPQKK